MNKRSFETNNAVMNASMLLKGYFTTESGIVNINQLLISIQLFRMVNN